MASPRCRPRTYTGGDITACKTPLSGLDGSHQGQTKRLPCDLPSADPDATPDAEPRLAGTTLNNSTSTLHAESPGWEPLRPRRRCLTRRPWRCYDPGHMADLSQRSRRQHLPGRADNGRRQPHRRGALTTWTPDPRSVGHPQTDPDATPSEIGKRLGITLRAWPTSSST